MSCDLNPDIQARGIISTHFHNVRLPRPFTQCRLMKVCTILVRENRRRRSVIRGGERRLEIWIPENRRVDARRWDALKRQVCQRHRTRVSSGLQGSISVAVTAPPRSHAGRVHPGSETSKDLVSSLRPWLSLRHRPTLDAIKCFPNELVSVSTLS